MNLSSEPGHRVSVMLIIALLFFCFGTTIAYSENPDSAKLDVVLVLDGSGSMEDSDPEKLGIEAAKLFIDMCHAQGDKICAVSYNDSIISETEFKLISSIKDKQALKDNISNTPQLRGTDIGLALKRAVSLMENGHDPTHMPLIILLSDGKNEPQRPMEESQNDIDNAVKTCNDKGYFIYTIGLNADGTVDKELLSNISASTKAKSFITNRADELPKILREIFADYSKLKVISIASIQADGQYQDVKAQVPNSNVVEANITALSQNPVQLKLIDPKGQEQIMPSDRAYYSASQKYSMIKLLSPAQGEWVLSVKGTNGDKIDISMVYNYDLKLAVDIMPKEVHKGDEIKISSYLVSNEERLKDDELYKDLRAKLIIRDMKQPDSIKEMDMSNLGDGFEGRYNVKDSNEMEISVRVEGTSFYREGEPILINTQNRPPIIKDKLSEIKVKEGELQEIDLDSVFFDPDNDSLSYSVTGDYTKIADVSISESTLSILPKSRGSFALTVSAIDGQEGTVSQDMTFEVTSITLYIIIVAVILALIALAVIFTITHKRNRQAEKGFAGHIIMEIKNEETGEIENPGPRPLDNYIGKFTLFQLLSMLPQYKEAEGVVFTPGKEDWLNITTTGNCVIKRYGKTIVSEKTQELKGGESITIFLRIIPVSVTLDYING